MTKQLEQRIAELEQRVKQLEGGEATAYWEPKDGDEVYILSECGEALDVFYSYEYIKEHSQGNIFRTEQKAIAESKRRAVIQKIQKYRNGFMPDWSDIKQDKWAMCYDHDAKKIKPFCCGLYQHLPDNMQFSSRTDVQTCLIEFGDELLALWGMEK
jgi:hypothetical protein